MRATRGGFKSAAPPCAHLPLLSHHRNLQTASESPRNFPQRDFGVIALDIVGFIECLTTYIRLAAARYSSTSDDPAARPTQSKLKWDF